MPKHLIEREIPGVGELFAKHVPANRVCTRSNGGGVALGSVLSCVTRMVTNRAEFPRIASSR